MCRVSLLVDGANRGMLALTPLLINSVTGMTTDDKVAGKAGQPSSACWAPKVTMNVCKRLVQARTSSA